MLGTLSLPFRPPAAVTFVIVNNHASGAIAPFNSITIGTDGTVTCNQIVAEAGGVGDAVVGSFLYVI